MDRVLKTMLVAGAPLPSPESTASSADYYSFAVEYDGPPIPYEIPKAVPIDVERIPVAAVVSEPAGVVSDPRSLPVVQPLPSPGPSKRRIGGVPVAVASAVAAPKSPTSVIENYAAMDGGVDVSGEVGSSGCPDLSAEMSLVVDNSGVVGFSDELKESEAFSEGTVPHRLSTESTISSESDFQSDAFEGDGDSEEEEDDDEAVAMQAKKALLVTFHEYGESDIVGETPPLRSEELELKVRKGACCNCLKGNRFTEKEACLVCDAKYCSSCVLRVMGSMPEGRKCTSCIGCPIMESKREKLGKSSRMLKRLLGSLEIQQAMKAERECEANQLRPEHISVNGIRISREELFLLRTCACPPAKLKPGYYWYDSMSGYWGKVGYKPDQIITPNLNIGGTLHRSASNGNTGILINGREITKVELKMLKWAGVQCAGNPHFWLNADGVIQEEGQKKILGDIWGKPMMKLLCPVLSLPIPSKDANFAGEVPASLANRQFADHLDHGVPQKLLLVGFHKSGTSTIFKQAKFLYRSVPFSDNELQDIKFMIQSSVFKYLTIILECRELFQEESLLEQRKDQVLSSEECTDLTEFSIGSRLKEFSEWFLAIASSGNLEAFFPAASREYAPLVEELWSDPAIQATYRRISEFQLLPSSASYFLERVVDISRVEYEPSDMDILYADGIASSTGLAFTDFDVQHLNLVRRDINDSDQQDMFQRYQLIKVDTEGLQNTCKWLDMFEDVRLVIYCVALSDYDVFYEDINGAVINKLMESKRHFETIVNHPALCDKEFLLVLSKFDLLEQKINCNPLSLCEWFVDFCPLTSQHRPKKIDSHSATLAQQASYFIAVKFKRLFTSMTGKKLYVKVINGLQAESVDSAIRYAGEIIKWDEERLVFEFAHGVSFCSEPSSFFS